MNLPAARTSLTPTLSRSGERESAPLLTLTLSCGEMVVMVYPPVPYLFNLRVDPMELFDPHSPEWGYMGRKLFAEKLWTLIPAKGIIAEHIKSLQEWAPRQRAESLSMQKAMETVMKAMERSPGGMQ